MRLFDSHCHIQLPQFDADRTEVLQRMQEKKVGAVVVGTDLRVSQQAFLLAEQHDFLWASVGLHPNDSKEQFNVKNFEVLASHPKTVAIGECGLDYFRSGKTESERSRQKNLFISHIELALSVHKPLIIHCREAHDDMLVILRQYKKEYADALQAVIHFFTGSSELAQSYLALDCYLSFPGPITYTQMYDASIRVTPLEKILTETDAPFAAPVPYRGKRNEPIYVEKTLEKIAAIKELSVEEVQKTIIENSRRVFILH